MKISLLFHGLRPLLVKRMHVQLQMVQHWLLGAMAVKIGFRHAEGELLAILREQAEVGDSVRRYRSYSPT